MISVAASTRIHAFPLAEQLEKHEMLDRLLTSYAYMKNTIARRWIRRVDREAIPPEKIRTLLPLALPIRLLPRYSYRWNDWFDVWAAAQLKKVSSRVFIGWSGMSLSCIRQAHKQGMMAIVERGSSHILTQHSILQEEYARFGKPFAIHPAVIRRELKEYEEADYISIPSRFVRDSFIAHGVPETKLLLNPYGAHLSTVTRDETDGTRPFRIVYLGALSIRKGLLYLFRALQRLTLPAAAFEVWFIGGIQPEVEPLIAEFRQSNWTFFGHVAPAEVPGYLRQCDAAVQPSLEEGLSMVIPQLMAAGIPVVITPNTGGENILTDGIDGFVVPVRDPEAIAAKLTRLFTDRSLLRRMQGAAGDAIANGYTWNDYGNRYVEHIRQITGGNVK